MFSLIFISFKDFAARIFIGWVVTENLFSPGDKEVGKLLDSLELTFLENFLIWLLKILNIFSLFLSFFLSLKSSVLSLPHSLSVLCYLFTPIIESVYLILRPLSLALRISHCELTFSLSPLFTECLSLSRSQIWVPLPLSSKLVSLPNSLSLSQISLSLSINTLSLSLSLSHFLMFHFLTLILIFAVNKNLQNSK